MCSKGWQYSVQRARQSALPERLLKKIHDTERDVLRAALHTVSRLSVTASSTSSTAPTPSGHGTATRSASMKRFKIPSFAPKIHSEFALFFLL